MQPLLFHIYNVQTKTVFFSVICNFLSNRPTTYTAHRRVFLTLSSPVVLNVTLQGVQGHTGLPTLLNF